jgi:hypothetical protein
VITPVIVGAAILTVAAATGVGDYRPPSVTAADRTDITPVRAVSKAHCIQFCITRQTVQLAPNLVCAIGQLWSAFVQPCQVAADMQCFSPKDSSAVL